MVAIQLGGGPYGKLKFNQDTSNLELINHAGDVVWYVTPDGNVVASGTFTPTGVIDGPDGAVGTPAYSFASDPDTGFYRIGANNIGIAAGGTKYVDINSTRMEIENEFAAPSSAGLIHFSFPYDAASVDRSFVVVPRACKVVKIYANVTVQGSDGGAVTAVAKKAPSGTAIGSGTALQSDTFNLKGTLNTNQTGTLSSTPADLALAAGDKVGVDFTGTMTAAVGVISVWAVPI